MTDIAGVNAGGLVLTSGWTGIDFGRYAPGDSVKKVETNAIISAVNRALR